MLDDLSNMQPMNQRIQNKWPMIDALAASLGASRAARLKWRTRGVPYRWQLILIRSSDGAIRPDDFLPATHEVAA